MDLKALGVSSVSYAVEYGIYFWTYMALNRNQTWRSNEGKGNREPVNFCSL